MYFEWKSTSKLPNPEPWIGNHQGVAVPGTGSPIGLQPQGPQERRPLSKLLQVRGDEELDYINIYHLGSLM